MFLNRLQLSFLNGEYTWFFLLLLSFILSFLLTPVFRWIALKFNILDIPDKRKIHKNALPPLGGLAIYFSYMVIVILNFFLSGELKGIIIGGTVIVLAGLIDDIVDISAYWKLLGQTIAFCILIFYGVKVNFLPDTWWGIGGEVFITFIWVIGITNAVNFFDGMDGLAAGLVVIGSLCFFIAALIIHQPYLACLSITLKGRKPRHRL